MITRPSAKKLQAIGAVGRLYKTPRPIDRLAATDLKEIDRAEEHSQKGIAVNKRHEHADARGAAHRFARVVQRQDEEVLQDTDDA